MPLELSVNDATVCRIALELWITIIEASFTQICEVYSSGLIYDNRQLIDSLKSWYVYITGHYKTFLEASFPLIYNVFSSAITYNSCQYRSTIDNRNMFIVLATGVYTIKLFKTVLNSALW